MYSFSWLHLRTLISQTTIVSEKSIVLPFPIQSIRDQIWPCHKIGEGQPKVIIWTNLVVLEHPMLHTKFQGHQPFGSGEEDFLRFLSYMGMVAILVMSPGPFEQTFVPPSHRSYMWNLTLTGPVVSEQKMFKECGRRRTNDRGLRSGELNKKICKKKNFGKVSHLKIFFI